jgi:hypothetical protein
MKRVIATLFLVLCAMVGSASAGSGFDRMKTLVGQWDATGPEGKTRVTFQLISQGTALMETLVNESMVTVYHPDGEAISMTHYCAAGNQPRMRAQSSKGDSIAFQFVDAGNLKKSSDGHMARLVITFHDADHITEEWTWTAGGKENTSVFKLERVK